MLTGDIGNPVLNQIAISFDCFRFRCHQMCSPNDRCLLNSDRTYGISNLKLFRISPRSQISQIIKNLTKSKLKMSNSQSIIRNP